MFFRNLLRVTLVSVFIAVCFCILFLGPMLNIAGLIPFGWALFLLLVSIILLTTTVLTYGAKVTNFLSKAGVK
jgi:hypothetical protein